MKAIRTFLLTFALARLSVADEKHPERDLIDIRSLISCDLALGADTALASEIFYRPNQ
jgi:hypothetical protein